MGQNEAAAEVASGSVWREQVVRLLRDGGEHRLAARVENCSRRFGAYVCSRCMDGDRAVPVRCGVRVCPECARVESRRQLSAVRAMVSRAKYPAHLVLTVPSVPELTASVLDRLLKGFERLRHRAFWKRNVRGAVRKLEITYNSEAGTWHPHLHLVVDCVWWAQDELARMWFDCLDQEWKAEILAAGMDRQAVVWISRVRRQDVGGVVAEICKYVSKSSDFSTVKDPAEYCRMVRLLKGRRIIASYGSMYGLEVADSEDHPFVCPCCGEEALEWVAVVDVEEVAGGRLLRPDKWRLELAARMVRAAGGWA